MKKLLAVLAVLVVFAFANKGDEIKYLALGDSYTIGTAIGKQNAYPVLLVDSMKKGIPNFYADLDVIAENGWTTRDLLNGIAKENPKGPYDMVSLLIGVNNQYQHLSKSQYKTEFTQLLEKSIALAGGKKENVFVISIPDYGVCTVAVENMKSISPDIDAFNEINKSVAEEYNVSYVDITEISRTAKGNESLIASDGLHFSSKMHELWVREIMSEYLLERF
ncbi:lysophospholipase L1-like esterase [Owenweeksia hongkongensis DSM 17368]|uniref:Lysophospholipase L1-like esterase n=1 Tax=Owenweeksia hongkongensis (strain DSM 17368 / CIP 108786 / JCM 12287 / NRRL B-23963 / UST20020801) TaxID=926562 RepID=G8R4C6_OWEHD|nr:SGNH/GDSL hydrolase family protein [Owenweeksia hongkongensis]AEV34226.1 lysophospholipase L1-like esterase [Owenweeksia hongkongensis DSM 17368]